MDSTLEKTLINELLGQNGFIILNKRREIEVTEVNNFSDNIINGFASILY